MTTIETKSAKEIVEDKLIAKIVVFIIMVLAFVLNLAKYSVLALIPLSIVYFFIPTILTATCWVVGIAYACGVAMTFVGCVLCGMAMSICVENPELAEQL